MHYFNFSKKLLDTSNKAFKMCKDIFLEIENNSDLNQQKVLKAFIDQKISSRHFNLSTGYGYDDSGRDSLDKLYSQIFDGQDALVRHNIVNGTHAISTALFGVLRPGDCMVSITGKPYDTLKKVIDCEEKSYGSLKDLGVSYLEVNPFCLDETLDYEKIELFLKKIKKINLIYLQRSKGYFFRPSVSIEKIKMLVSVVKKFHKNAVILCDNCYCEFVESCEPLKFGVDLIAGSLIKNPGGGIAPCGGYIVGKKELIKKCAFRLTTPGAGKDVGANLGVNRELYMGVFNAPFVVSQALKVSVFASCVFELLGFEVFPRYDDQRVDIVQMIKLERREALLAFCKGIQMASPVDSFVVPEPWLMPGYEDEIIMAAGTFTQGASIELTADAPFKKPFFVWLQGSLNFSSGKIGVLSAADQILKFGF
ncbi:MAG: methionine gamma-lyase family protein [Oscillospiraceae bacterium]|jgi:cystathionine beta-lyase family protein involved in aluminum resistance|nr:methionine gamma-lyase family protein [Oscillospiraceae bacterium]